jgi:hypothetical protein
MVAQKYTSRQNHRPFVLMPLSCPSILLLVPPHLCYDKSDQRYEVSLIHSSGFSAPAQCTGAETESLGCQADDILLGSLLRNGKSS